MFIGNQCLVVIKHVIYTILDNLVMRYSDVSVNFIEDIFSKEQLFKGGRIILYHTGNEVVLSYSRLRG